MENIEILGFQLSLPRHFNLIPSLDKSWETCSSGDSEPNPIRQNKASVDNLVHVSTVVKSKTKECLCYHELNMCKYCKIKRSHVYLLPILQISLSS